MWNLPMISPVAGREHDHQRGEPDDVQPGQPDRDGPVSDGLQGLRPDHEGRLGEEGALVGFRPGHRALAGPEVRHRPRQHEQHEQPLGCARGRRGPEQQLPARRQPARRPGQGEHVLRQGAVHAVGEHGLARAEHDRQAAERPGVPQGSRRVDQRQPGRHAGLREPRPAGEPDGPAADLEQVRRHQRSRGERVQVRPG